MVVTQLPEIASGHYVPLAMTEGVPLAMTNGRGVASTEIATGLSGPRNDSKGSKRLGIL